MHYTLTPFQLNLIIWPFLFLSAATILFAASFLLLQLGALPYILTRLQRSWRCWMYLTQRPQMAIRLDKLMAKHEKEDDCLRRAFEMDRVLNQYLPLVVMSYESSQGNEKDSYQKMLWDMIRSLAEDGDAQWKLYKKATGKED